MASLQDFLADGALKAAKDLEAALLKLPDDKRDWSAGGTARSAIDMVAEIAILNGTTAQMLQDKRGMTDSDFAAFVQQKLALAADWNALQSLLHQNTQRVADTIRTLPDDDLGVEVSMPWGTMTLQQMISYPYWNAHYHEGQINFIASILGCLD